ncbi:MAG: hypothetical protein WKG07_29805 [Hymenobacter sp.]
MLGSGFAPASADPRLFAAPAAAKYAGGYPGVLEERPLLLLACSLAVLGLEARPRCGAGARCAATRGPFTACFASP